MNDFNCFSTIPMTTLTDLVPDLRELNGFDSSFFKYRNGKGHLLFVNNAQKRFYETKTINASAYLAACVRAFKGAPKCFGENFGNMIDQTTERDWSVYFRPENMLQLELDTICKFLSDYQRVVKRSTRKNNQQKTTWVYLLSHKASGRRFHLLADNPMEQVEAIGMFMRHWKQNNTDCLDRKMIQLGSYYESMHHFQEATCAIQKHDYLQFEFATVQNLQGVSREKARHTTTNMNRVDTIKYFQNIYKRLKQNGSTLVHQAQAIKSHDPCAY